MHRDLLLAPLVIAQRMPLLWMEAFGLRAGDRESERMVREKLAAVTEGAVAMNIELQRIWWQSSVAMMSGAKPVSLTQTGVRLAEAGLRPAAKRVRSNVRRLSGRSGKD